jgi:hypothetical protein
VSPLYNPVMSPTAPGPLTSGNYYPSLGATSLTTSAALGNGTLRLHPVYIPNPVSIVRLGAEIASGTTGDVGCTFRLGIYSDTGGGYPGALVSDAGTIAADSTGVKEVTISVALAPGLYWMGGVVQGVTVTQPTVKTFNAVNFLQYLSFGTSAPTANQTTLGYTQASVTAALPASFTATITPATVMPRVHFKVG